MSSFCSCSASESPVWTTVDKKQFMLVRYMQRGLNAQAEGKLLGSKLRQTDDLCWLVCFYGRSAQSQNVLNNILIAGNYYPASFSSVQLKNGFSVTLVWLVLELCMCCYTSSSFSLRPSPLPWKVVQPLARVSEFFTSVLTIKILSERNMETWTFNVPRERFPRELTLHMWH